MGLLPLAANPVNLAHSHFGRKFIFILAAYADELIGYGGAEVTLPDQNRTEGSLLFDAVQAA